MAQTEAVTPTGERDKHPPGLESVLVEPWAEGVDLEIESDDSVLVIRTEGWQMEYEREGEPAEVALDLERDNIITRERNRVDSPTSLGEIVVEVNVLVEDHGQCVTFAPRRETWVGTDAAPSHEERRTGGNSEAIR